MGWWVEDKLTIGDEPIDRMIHTLDEIREDYRTEQGREPTYGEVARFVEQALRCVLDSMSDSARVDAKIKITAKRMKKQRATVGDVFLIKLDTCHYGRVIWMDNSGTLVEFFQKTSPNPLTVRQIECERKNVKHFKWVFANDVFEDFSWKVIGNVPLAKDYEYPEFLYGEGKHLFAERVDRPREYAFYTHDEILKLHIEPQVSFTRDVYEKNLREGRSDPWPEILACLQGRGVKVK